MFQTFVIACAIGIGSSLWVCGQDVPPGYAVDVRKMRTQKDLEFRGGSSPLPQKDRKEFSGLRYFDVDPTYRLEVKLHPIAKEEPIEMITNTGERRKGVRYGYFDFKLKGKSLRLYAYKLEGSPPSLLFVPFTDQTSGVETYSGGRYLDLEQTKSGVYVLDFNLAYNPYCAYGSDRYSCPIPPPENHLEVEIRAGEQAWLKAKKAK